MRACIYTAIYGGYDDLKPQPSQTIPTDFICFSDEEIRPIEPWMIIVNRDRPELSPRMRAKYFKLLSHQVFPGGRLSYRISLRQTLRSLLTRYEYVIWIDGSAQIKTNQFVEKLISDVGNSGWALFDHPDRNCIYDEMPASRGFRKYDACPLEEQIEHYRREGFPVNNGLAACGLIIRHTRRSDLNAINEMWWEENMKWGYQDQLSLPVVLWRQGRTYSRIPGSLWHNDLVNWQGHRSEKADV